MSQVPSEDRRKFIFAFSGPAVSENGHDYPGMLEFFAQKYLKWKLEESHCVPTTATIQIGGKPSQMSDRSDNSSPNTSTMKPKESVPVGHNQVSVDTPLYADTILPVSPRPAASKPPSLTVETLLEHLAKWLDKVEVTPILNGFAVKPRHFLLRETWQAIDDALRTIGAKWIPQAKGVGSWQVPS